MNRYYVTGQLETWAVDAESVEHLAAKIHERYQPWIGRDFEVRLDVDGRLNPLGTGTIRYASDGGLLARITIRMGRRAAA